MNIRLVTKIWMPLIVSLLCLIIEAWAAPESPALPALPAVPSYEVGEVKVSLTDFPVYFVSDESRSLTVSDIAAGRLEGEVRPSRYYIPEVHADRWFIFDVTNSSDENVTRIVRLDEAIFQEANLYYRDQEGAWIEFRAGLDTPIADRMLQNRTPSFAVTLAPGETKRLYLKFYCSTFLLTLGTRLESPEEAALYEQGFLIFYAGFYGALAALLAYNLFLFISLRDPVYVYYVLHGVCFLIWMAFFAGFDQYFHNDEETGERLLVVVPLVAAFQMAFMRSLLDTKRYLPTVDKFLLATAFYFFGISLATFINPDLYHYLALSVPPLVIVMLMIAVYAVYRRVPMAPYYLVASTGQAYCNFLVASVGIGTVEYSFFARHGVLLGFTAEMIIYALALARKVKLLEQEKLHYQDEAIRIEQHARERLEDLVDQRTEELQRSNLELERLSQTDSLTGLYNRRFFDQRLDEEWKRHQRSNGVLSLIIGDIDFFKKFNDHYGHLEGDSCIQMVARKIAEATGRPGDVSARYGGEEFIVLLPETGCEGAREIATNILNSIVGEQVPHVLSDLGHISMSFGVAEFQPSETPSSHEAIKEVDDLLYQAKENGRAQVVTA